MNELFANMLVRPSRKIGLGLDASDATHATPPMRPCFIASQCDTATMVNSPTAGPGSKPPAPCAAAKMAKLLPEHRDR